MPNERESIMKSILDPSFRYTPSVSTDLRKTFARIRRLERESQAQAGQQSANAAKVVRIDATRKVVTAAPRAN
jgi:hypothetical protein